MKPLNSWMLVLALTSSLVTLSWGPQDTGAAVAEKATAFQAAQEHLESSLERGVYNGVVAMIERDGERVFESALGHQEVAGDIEMQLDSIFRIYSMTKPVTAVAALILVDEGKLDLDAPLAKYLPEFEGIEVGVETKDEEGKPTLEKVAAQRPISVRDLFCHTSGFSYGFMDDSMVDRLLLSNGVFDEEQTSAEFVTKLSKIPLKHQPGTQFEYSFSTDVLGRVVEVLSEQTLAEFMAERIFTPLGMKDTGFCVPEENLERVAECYVREGGKLAVAKDALDPAVDPPMYWGGAGLFCTANDYLIFCRMLLGGGTLGDQRILAKETVDAMFTDQLDGAPAPMLFFTGGQFGLGLALNGRSSKGPNEGTGWWGGYAGTGFWIDREANLIGVFMVQNMAEVMHTSAFQSAVYKELGR